LERYDYICHHGIKGMKWGQRLYQNSDGSLTPLGRLRYGSGNGKNGGNGNKGVAAKQTTSTASNSSEIPNYSAKARAKNIDSMTDQELNTYINRIRLEQSYKQLTAAPATPKKVSAGKAFATYSWNNIVKPTATTLAKGTLEYVGKTYINNATGKPIFKMKGDGNNND